MKADRFSKMATRRIAKKVQPKARTRPGSQNLAGYEIDDGPLNGAQQKAIEKLVPQGQMKVTKSLF